MKLQKITEQLTLLLEENEECLSVEEAKEIFKNELDDYDEEFDRVEEDKIKEFYNEIPVVRTGKYILIKDSAYKQYCEDLAGEFCQAMGDDLEFYVKEEELAQAFVNGHRGRGLSDGQYLVERVQRLLRTLYGEDAKRDVELFLSVTPVDKDCYLIETDD